MTLKTYDFVWHFPLPRTHTGILLGNGRLGVMIWGDGRTLRLTLGRADWWDHQGARSWTPGKTYSAIRRLLEAHDEAGIRDLFAQQKTGDGTVIFPTVIPIGRLDLDLGPGVTLTEGRLDIHTGVASLTVRTPRGKATLDLLVDPEQSCLLVRLPAALAAARLTARPAQRLVPQQFAERGFAVARLFRRAGLVGWTQSSPQDQTAAVVARRAPGVLAISVELATDIATARAQAMAVVAPAGRALWQTTARRSAAWWRAFWRATPRIEVPNRKLQFLYDYGMYKFATFTNPAAVAATLQGPWIEDYTFPPWSSDYHFNINVQMCYWPAFHGNHLAHLRPLFDLIREWLPVLRQNAKFFVGIDDGLMLPHAVDDRCHAIGAFWTGTIDHGCTAWVAQMMYQYYLYTQDRQFLRDEAYPFMVGAMRVYEEMLERRHGKLSLPVSTSPEYGGCAMSAWGRNASFQLAAIHMLAEALQKSAAVLDVRPRPIWRTIRTQLPKASLADVPKRPRLGLWDGQDLDETHRHHSHLAGITPFDVFDPADPQWRPILENSLHHWIYRGPGQWSGWCVPWAAMLHLRFGNADMAEMLLENFERVFTNEGHGTRHNGIVSGWTLMGVGPTGGRPSDEREIMQMDAGMSCVAAILEMLLHTQRGVNHLFAGAPASWGAVGFQGILTEGAFLVDAARGADGVVQDVVVTSRAGGVFRLANPWSASAVRVAPIGGGRDRMQRGDVLEIALRAGTRVRLTPAAREPRQG